VVTNRSRRIRYTGFALPSPPVLAGQACSVQKEASNYSDESTMIGLELEMTYRLRSVGPMETTVGSP
jgi:hypothetical protein